MLQIKTILNTSILINILFVIILQHDLTNRLIFESLLGGVITSLFIHNRNTSQSINKLEYDNYNTVKDLKRSHRHDMSKKQNELDALRETLNHINSSYDEYINSNNSEEEILRESIANSQFGHVYYITEKGSKLHKIQNCESIKGKNISSVVFNPTLIPVLRNADKMCSLCGSNGTQSLGVEFYYNPSGYKIYTSKEALSPQHRGRCAAEWSIMSKNEFNTLKNKFPEIIKESI